MELPDDNCPLFVITLIRPFNIERVLENLFGIVKRNAVLAQVQLSFCNVPLKLHIFFILVSRTPVNSAQTIGRPQLIALSFV